MMFRFLRKNKEEKKSVTKEQKTVSSEEKMLFTKDEFQAIAKRFIDAGYMKELYINDFLAIYNFGDAVYLVCPFFPVADDVAFGMMMPAEIVQEVVNDNQLLAHLFKDSVKQGVLSQRIIPLNDHSFNLGEEGIEYLRNRYQDDYINPKFDKALLDFYHQTSKASHKFKSGK